MSIYNDTVTPVEEVVLVTKKPFLTERIRDYLSYRKYNLTGKSWFGATRRHDIPMYETRQKEEEREAVKCNSTTCTIMQYSLLTACALAFVCLIAFYSYVGYKSETLI